MRHAVSLTLVVLFVIGCTKSKKEETTTAIKDSVNEGETYIVSDEERTWDTASYETLRKTLPPFDLNQNLSNKSLEELRILENTIPARYGFLFMTADLRYYFYQQPWYRKIMEARWYGDCESSGLKKAPSIEYSEEEEAFLDKIKQLKEEKLKENYIVRNGLKYANVKNIVNAWQFNGLPSALLAGIDKNGFAIVPAENTQLFHVYEQNDYSQTQNFVTTDLYLQLFHMHFSFMLRELEESHFSPIIETLTAGIVFEANKLKEASRKDVVIEDACNYAIAFYDIPNQIISRNSYFIYPTTYKAQAQTEMKNIKNGVAKPSALIPAYSEYNFPYDMFKPRGHYTRNDSLKRYFMAMQWLQTASYCLDDDRDLRRALIAGYVLSNGKTTEGKKLKSLYDAVVKPTSFLIGKPDNLSMDDVCELIAKNRISTVTELLTVQSIALFRSQLKEIESAKNVIKPKIQMTCASKINFMPARFVLDNEILQEMAEPEARPFPRGLDVLTAFGNVSAEEVLMAEEKNSEWDKFLPNLNAMKAKYGNYENWDETVYAKWINSLNELLKKDDRYPSFMQLPSWNKKNLNTALASWAELKHDAILYAEQPNAAECGGGGECEPPPEPYTLGYVEPNVRYWHEALSLLDVSEQLFETHGLFDDFKYRHHELREMCEFLLKTSEKELKGEALTEQEHNTIERIGTSVEMLTLRIFGADAWSSISGPDKSISIVADVYTNNIGDKAGVLHAAVGYGNELYVVVEIEGYLYLVKGSTFSYYEFVKPLNDRMTDEEWQEELKNGKVYPIQKWMKDVIIDVDKKLTPTTKEYLYSSGC